VNVQATAQDSAYEQNVYLCTILKM